jgi:hypothetical protein
VDASGSEWEPVAGSYKHGNEPSGFIKDEFIDYLVTISLSRRILLHGVGWLVGRSVGRSVSNNTSMTTDRNFVKWDQY